MTNRQMMGRVLRQNKTRKEALAEAVEFIRNSNVNGRVSATVEIMHSQVRVFISQPGSKISLWYSFRFDPNTPQEKRSVK